ncbi:MAG TPA: DUF2752 domain-containing protein [Thermoanaerobaculaceae bacterium]|nr:DUF2752 domain-containing protein [Thermoanaerobaculaceae bacterium]
MAAVFMPVGLLDDGPVLCPIRLLGGDWCWGCGITRACWHVIHGDLAGALARNRLVILVAPLLLFLYLRWVFRTLSPPTQAQGSRLKAQGPPPTHFPDR